MKKNNRKQKQKQKLLHLIKMLQWDLGVLNPKDFPFHVEGKRDLTDVRQFVRWANDYALWFTSAYRTKQRHYEFIPIWKTQKTWHLARKSEMKKVIKALKKAIKLRDEK